MLGEFGLDPPYVSGDLANYLVAFSSSLQFDNDQIVVTIYTQQIDSTDFGRVLPPRNPVFVLEK